MLLLAVLAACRPEFDTLEEACKDKVAGSASVSDESADYVRRATCYRRYVGLGQGRVDDLVTEASANHAGYLALNPGSDPRLEDPTAEGFTGRDIQDRLDWVGYTAIAGNTEAFGFWEGDWFYAENEEPLAAADIPDTWIHDLYFKQLLLQPAWVDGGFATVDKVQVTTLVYRFPASERVARPVSWPVDGATNVPTTYIHAYPGDVIPDLTPVGYPIQLMVGGTTGRVATETNPYGIVVRSSTITDNAGEIAHIVVTPDRATYAFPASVALVPEEPLTPVTLYEWTIDLEWDDTVRRTVTGRFRTGADGTPTARSLGVPFTLTHRIVDPSRGL